MANQNFADLPAPRPFDPQASDAVKGGVTIRNDVDHDVMLCLKNAAWGMISVGYARAGESVTLPSIVNVDAFALYQGAFGVFIQGLRVWATRYKINLTPNQTYSVSDFDWADS